MRSRSLYEALFGRQKEPARVIIRRSLIYQLARNNALRLQLSLF